MQINLAFSRNDLDRTLAETHYSPEALISLFEKNFLHEYAADTGVWEGYSLKRHTLMVLYQYEKYFAPYPLPHKLLTPNFMRVLLALHDIGKPEAIKNGDKTLQHTFTTEIIRPTLTALKYSPAEINIATALINGDPIGRHLRYNTPHESASDIKRMATKVSLSSQTFFTTLLVYFMSDASSYTRDAGGFESLDHLFIFGQPLAFSPAVEEKINNLRDLIA